LIVKRVQIGLQLD
jgi:hypothetical protein